MADKNINILLKLTDKFTPELKGTTKEIRAQKKQLNAATTQLRKWGNAANNSFKSVVGMAGKVGLAFATLGGAISVAGIKHFADQSMELAETQVKAETLLEQVLSNVDSIASGGSDAVQKAKQELLDYASTLQGVGVIGDEVTISGMQQLATFGMNTEQIKLLSGSMDDLIAKQFGLDATTENAVAVANALGKAMNGSTGALTKMGIALTDEEKKLLSVGDEATRAANLAKILEDRVGGVNAALADTDQGKIQQAANAYGDFQEEVGKRLLSIKAGLAGIFMEALPALQDKTMDVVDKLTGKLDSVAAWIKENKAAIANALTTVGNVLGTVFNLAGKGISFLIEHGNVLVPVLTGIVAGFTAFNILSTVIPLVSAVITVVRDAAVAGGILNAVMMASPIGAVCIAIGALVATGVLLYKNWDTVKAKAQQLWAKVKSVFDNMKTAVSSLKDKFIGAFQTIHNKVSGIVDKIKKFLQPLTDVIGGIGRGLSALGFGGSGGSGNNDTYQKKALGTDYFSGGLTHINEGGRGEIVNLPNGTQIIPHDVATRATGGTTVNVSVNIQGNVIGNRDYMEQVGQYIANRVLAAQGVV